MLSKRLCCFGDRALAVPVLLVLCGLLGPFLGSMPANAQNPSWYQSANGVQGQLAGEELSAATELELDTGQGALFPSTFPFVVHLENGNELAIVTGRTGDTLTVTRGAEGTTPTLQAQGSNVSMVISAGVFQQLQTVVDELIDGGRAFDLVSVAASASGGATVNIPHGVAPSTPTNGDFWTTTAGVFARINGATVGPLVDATGAVASLDDLTDVIITTPANPSILIYNGSEWIDATTISALTVSTLTSNEVIVPQLTNTTGNITINANSGAGTAFVANKLEINTSAFPNVDLDASQHAGFLVDRGSSAWVAVVRYATAGSNNWDLGLHSGGGSTDFEVYNYNLAKTVVQYANSDGSTNYFLGDATADVITRFGASKTEGYEQLVIDETVSSLSAISTDLTEDIPSGAVILCVQGNIETLVVESVGTGAAVGIGTAADPDKYGETAGFTQNDKIDTIPAHAVLSGAEDIQVHITDGGGNLSDTAPTAGAVRVRIVYAFTNSLDDA